MPTERSRKRGKRTVADSHKGDRGDTKRGGSVVERIVRKLTGGIGVRRPDYQTSHCDYAEVLEPDLLQSATTRNRGREKILAIQSFSGKCSHFLRASGPTVA